MQRFTQGLSQALRYQSGFFDLRWVGGWDEGETCGHLKKKEDQTSQNSHLSTDMSFKLMHAETNFVSSSPSCRLNFKRIPQASLPNCRFPNIAYESS